MLLFATPFSGGQLTLIIIIAVVFVLSVAANALLLYLLRRRKTRSKLCAAALQQRRDELLKELEGLRFMTTTKAADEEADEVLATDSAVAATESRPIRAGSLSVTDMTDEMRKRFRLAGQEFENKRYYVRYNYSFQAKLRLSGDEVKARYVELADEIFRYKKLVLRNSFRHQRICYGRKTLGLLLFRGKTLCVALALNPKDYEQTKYKGKDVGDKKRFAKTPMLLKITSARRLVYAKYLLNRLAEDKLIQMNETPTKASYDLQPMNLGELFAEKLVKITVIGEAPQK